MKISKLQACPFCETSISVYSYWRNVPENRYGLPSWSNSSPGFSCPNCTENVAIRYWQLSLFVVLSWPALFVGMFTWTPLRTYRDPIIAITIIMATGACYLLQLVVTPYLVRLAKPFKDEELNIVTSD
jgi:hypothetical protein